MLKRAAFVALVLTLFVTPALNAQNTAANDRLTLDLYLDLEGVSNPRLSPDGTQIIYTRQWVDKVNDRRESSLWIMNADGSRNRFLVDGSNAVWSPTGDRIAYTAQGKPRGSQIFVRWMDAEGATSQITQLEKSPSNIAWSPDGPQIGFTMQVEERNNWPIKMPRAPEGAKWVETPKIVERLNYRRDGTGFTDTAYTHIFVVPASGGTPKQLTSGNYNHNGVEWTTDGKSIIFSGLRVPDAEYQWRETEIYSVDAATGNVKQLTNRKGPDGNPTISNDGKLIAYTGYDWAKDSWIDSKLYVMNADGTNPRLVSGTWDRSPSQLIWAPDNNGIYFTAQSEGSQNLYYLALNGRNAGEVQQVTKGVQMLTTTDINRNGRAVGVLSSSYKPNDVVTFQVNDTANIKQLTNVNEDILAGKKLGKVEEIWYTSKDGLKIQGWYITPPDFAPSKKYPMQLHIHGGPHSMYGVGFNFGWQE
ncbi:MAG: S9 family peptidase, partial [Acidobacteria bacterium]|nr:S9 family peptidase [Acidobacteriota bacterium]